MKSRFVLLQLKMEKIVREQINCQSAKKFCLDDAMRSLRICYYSTFQKSVD